MNSHSLTTCVALRRQSVHKEVCGYPRKLVAMAVLFMTGILLLGASTGLAKDKKPATKLVTGVVFDAADNPIDGAMVELTDVQTSKVLDIYSQEDGHYQFAGLLFSHDYKIKATYKGSSSEVRHISSLDLRTRPVLNLTIPTPKK